MKVKIYALAALTVLLLAACQSGLTVTDPFAVEWDDLEVFRQGLVRSERGALDDLPGATIYHIDLEIEDDLLTLYGHQEMLYTNREEDYLSELYFQLFPNATGGASTVSHLTVDDQDIDPYYEFEDSAIRVPLPQLLEPGGQIVVEFDFEVEVAQRMAGNHGLFGYFSDILVLDSFYPVIPVYDDEGWNVQYPPGNGDTSYNDVSFYLVRVTAPARLVIAATGVEVGREEEEGERQRVTFASGPARDFYLAASEHYVQVSQRVGETTVNSYALVGREDSAREALEAAVASLGVFGERMGTYPYTELDVASTPMSALGIEYPGMVGISLQLYVTQDAGMDEQGVGGRSMGQTPIDYVVVHEVAHQWVYNIVGNDQIDEPWLDEATAQFLTGLYYEEARGGTSAQSIRLSWEDRWRSSDGSNLPIGLPADAYSSSEYGAIVYSRGPIFVLTLAGEMGEDVFFEFLEDYYESHKWGIATTESFRELAEEHCLCDLSDLFDEWVY